MPPNASAVLSTSGTNATQFALGGVALNEGKSALKAGKSDGEFLLPAGSYSFTATLQQTTTEVADATH